MSKVVYIHRRNDDNSIFYVGMGNTDRPYSKDKRSNEWLSEANKGYSVDVLISGLTKEDALELETFIISEIGLDNLTNKTVGGEGGHIHYNNKKVFQYTLNGDFLRGYSSIAEASRISRTTRQNISKCLKGDRDYAGGFIWSSVKGIKSPKSVLRDCSRVILDQNTGVFYENLKEYCELNELNKSTVWRWLSGKRTNKTNLKYV
jgi:hypothetical protein